MNQLRSHLKWTYKNQLRYWFLNKKIEKLGKNVFIEKNVQVFRFPKGVSISEHVILKEGCKICSCNKKASIKIGKYTTIGYYTFLFSSASISIGDNCLIAPFVYIVDSDHQIAKQDLINTQPNISDPIIIEDDVWIGTGAKILKGVHIGKGAVVASGALVKSDIKPYEIYGGIPAKKIGERK